MIDPFELQRFVEAQEQGGAWAQAQTELQQGAKRSHWMWFIFPQIRGLGHSAMARRYALEGKAEAGAYLEHALLGARLREAAAILLGLPPSSAVRIFGETDAQKLQSSMTLFAEAAPTETVFREVLERFFQGQADANTLTRLR